MCLQSVDYILLRWVGGLCGWGMEVWVCGQVTMLRRRFMRASMVTTEVGDYLEAHVVRVTPTGLILRFPALEASRCSKGLQAWLPLSKVRPFPAQWGRGTNALCAHRVGRGDERAE